MTAVRVPHHIFIDLSTACNATCVMCPTQIDSDRKKVMTDALFRKIAGEASVFSTEIDSFYFGVHGEPLIDKRLEQKVALCSELGITRTIVSSNGSLLDESRTIALLEAKPWVDCLTGIHVGRCLRKDPGRSESCGWCPTSNG
jgi:MoaA/NifB/PqqE/SkfB family radical SAM enzyme